MKVLLDHPAGPETTHRQGLRGHLLRLGSCRCVDGGMFLV